MNKNKKWKNIKKEYIKNITDEQKQKRKDYQKKYRANKKILKQQNKDNHLDRLKILKMILSYW